ncbi:Polysaccharide pyruvyl transferase family protein WcaK [Quadrisphaera granulorum]|uniref:Polysaccharide pyruvyl transferase WcaK-like protein n=1 Tax=Quadrisphaera granulorum TaxID=317664 RepID=A0A315ZSU9_9ACTN|nr:polysaccharide pyruvyl transferase family protein [Quadrisphaera granulorum]PWJ48635.1 polysaccharide pyruvyl transferase WcaK-like protein [Quadrisphaera granulorum]SZE98357.1 Polysaccharide pyruvyl transferase family protein WcaK [Quadrisphaera granulorum]
MKVFASAIGQYDNVGDTVLRRAFLQAVRTAGDLHVYVGRQTTDQTDALGLTPDDVLHRDSASWRAELSRTMGRTPALYAFDTGETELERRFAQRYLRLAPLLAANRLRGGAAVHVGVGVRRSTVWRHPIAAVLQTCQLVAWRDELSRRVLGVGEVAPDWAFHLGADEAALRSDHPRPVLAVALRAGLPHDPRPEPDEAWVASVREMAERTGLEPVFAAQIGRDGDLAELLAKRVGGSALCWESARHTDAEAALRALYRRSAVIVSDRLHGLVIAATEGASPLALSSHPTDKAARTLAAVGLRAAVVDHRLTDAGAAVAAVEAAAARRPEVVDRVIEARHALDRLVARISALGGGKAA